MAKTDGAPAVGSDRDSISLPTRLSRARHQRINATLSRSSELIETIETERARLMKAQAVLDCALVAMECESNADAPYYPDVLQLAQELVSQSITQLDSLRLRPMIEALQRTEPERFKGETPELDPRGDKELRDSANIIYIA